jgi:hypothetical protein
MAWRFNNPVLIDAQTSISAMRGRLVLLAQGSVPPDPAERDAIAAEVERLLDEAEQAATAEKRPWWPWWPRKRASVEGKLSWVQRHWHYTNVEAAFQTYHHARALAVKLYTERDVDMELPIAIAEAKARLAKNDPALARVEKLAIEKAANDKAADKKAANEKAADKKADDEKSVDERRAGLEQLVSDNYDATDDAHRRLQRFRNVIILLIVGVVALMVCTTFFFAKNPDWVPLCFDGDEPVPEGVVDIEPAPSADGATEGGDAVDPDTVESVVVTTVCPTDEGVDLESKSEDVTAVALMGFLGGSFAAVVALRNLGSTTTPFQVPVVLAVLKSPTGALTAMAGLIAIRGNFVPGLSDLDSSEQILAYALVLGYAQQLATGFLDRRAKEIAEKT